MLTHGHHGHINAECKETHAENHHKNGEDEGYEDVAITFKQVALVEHEHFITLNELHDKYTDKSIYHTPKESEWKCSQCGFSVFDKKAPEICPLCSFPQGSFEFKLTQNKPQ